MTLDAQTRTDEPDADVLEDLVKDELGRADTAMSRTETKTSILLAVVTSMFTVGLAVLPRVAMPLLPRIAFWVTLALLAAALLLLLWNVRPRLRGSGFATYAAMSDEEMARHFARVAGDPQQWHRHRLLVVARVGRTKFALLRAATNLLIAAVLCAVLAAVLTAV